MEKPTHRQQMVAVLWAQAFPAWEIAERFGTKEDAVHQLVARIRNNFPEAWKNIVRIRDSHRKAKVAIKDPRIYANLGSNHENELMITEDGQTSALKILQVF